MNIHWGSYVEDNSFGIHEFATFSKIEQAIIQQRALLDRYANGQRIGLLLDEWGISDRIPKEDETLWPALAAGHRAQRSRRRIGVECVQSPVRQAGHVQHRANLQCPSVAVTDRWPRREALCSYPHYHIFALFRQHRSNTAVRTESDSSADSGISASASKSENTLVITLVNSRTDADAKVNCLLRGLRAASGSAQILHDPDLNAANTFENPNRIVPQAWPVSAEAQQIRVDLPRLAVATITLRIVS